MKKMIFVAAFAFASLADAGILTRSSVHYFVRSATENVPEYDKARVEQFNQQQEDAAIKAAIRELGCGQFERLDIAQIDISPNVITPQQDQNVRVQVVGVCLDSRGMTLY